MSRWIRLYQQSLEGAAPAGLRERLLRGVERITPRTSPAAQAAWVHEAVETLEAELAEPDRRLILERCGRSCIGRSVLANARQIYASSQGMEDFLDRLNQAHIGGGRLAWRDGGVDAGYDRCYCGVVSQTQQPFSPTFCNCSRGWYLALFESCLGRPVEVTLLSSIIQGADRCRFRITLPDGA